MSKGEPNPGRTTVTFETVRRGSIPGALHRVIRRSPPGREGEKSITVQLDESHATRELVRHLNGLHAHIITSGLWAPRAGDDRAAEQSMRYEFAEPEQLPAAVPCVILEREGVLVLVVRRHAMTPALAAEMNQRLADVVGDGGEWLQHWGGSVQAMAS